jgi:hypothetical protein
MGRKVKKIREMRWEGKEMRDRKGGKKRDQGGSKRGWGDG